VAKIRQSIKNFKFLEDTAIHNNKSCTFVEKTKNGGTQTRSTENCGPANIKTII